MSVVKEKSVCVDIDGVVLNLMQGIHLYLEPLGYNFDIDHIEAYNFKYDSLGFDRQIIFNAINDVKSFELAPFYDGAIEALKKLQRFVETKSYTKISEIPEIYNRRKNLLEFLKLQGEPITALKKPVDFSVDALFDDCLDVHKQWIEEGSKAKLFLIDRPYNQKTTANEGSLDWSRIVRCKNFEEAVDFYIAGLIEG